MRGILAGLTAVLLLPAAAAAHVTISPPFVDDGVETEISFTVPNERPPHATVLVRVTTPSGISIKSAAAPTGWKAEVDGSTATWSSGRLEGNDTRVFSLRILTNVHPGTSTIRAGQTYDDGATVRWSSSLTVLPATGVAPEPRPWAIIAVAGVALFIIACGLVGLLLLRRRSLQVR